MLKPLSPVCPWKDEHPRQDSVCSGLAGGRGGLYGLSRRTGRALSIPTGVVSLLETPQQWLIGPGAARGFPGCTQWCLRGATDALLLVGCSNTGL